MLAVLHTLEYRPQCDFGLSEAHIAADETIHQMRALHVAFHGFDRLELVGCLDVGECGFHLCLPRCVGRERMTLGVQAALIEQHQLLGDDAQFVAHALFGACEVGTAHAVERRCVATDVLTHEVDLVAQHQQHTVGISNLQKVTLDAVERATRHTLEHSDAMHVVHHVVAGLEVFEHERTLSTSRTSSTCRASSAQLGFGREREFGERQHETLVHLAHDDDDAGFVFFGQQIRCRRIFD